MKNKVIQICIRHPRLRKTVCYLGVGASLGIVDFILFAAFTILLRFPPILANVICTSTTSSISFYLNRKWVFKEANAHALTFLGYIAVTLTSAYVVQNLVLMTAMRLLPAVTVLPRSFVLSTAKLAAQMLGALTNFLGYSLVFRCIAPHDRKCWRPTKIVRKSPSDPVRF